MDTDKLNTFITVAKEGGFSKAAKKLFRTQPAISQTIKALEKEVEEQLFIRLGKTVKLTYAGEILFEHAKTAFDIIEQGRNQIEALKELRGGRLTISASDTTTCYVLPEVLKRYHSLYPGVEILIQNTASPRAATQVLEGNSDIAILTLPVHEPNLTVEPFTVREDIVICSPLLDLAKKGKANMKDLAPYPLLLLDQSSNTRRFIDQKIAACPHPFNIQMELGSIEVIKKLVEMNFGISIVPKVSVLEEEKSGKLALLPIFSRYESQQLGLAYRSKILLSLPAKVFINILKGYFQTE